MKRPPISLLWRESHATSALVAGLVASVPASLAAAAMFALRDLLFTGEVGATFHLMGFAAQLGLGALAGAIFGITVAFTAHHLPPLAGAFWGAVYGLCVWLVWFVLILPLLRPELAGHTRLGLVAHVVYGVVLGSLFHVVRVTERRRHRLAAPTPPGGSPAGNAPPSR